MIIHDLQIEKLNSANFLANQAASSTDIAAHLGAVVIYAGLVDFSIIQTARLIEQIILKSQLASGEKLNFLPNDDSYFYSKKISTGKILKDIHKLLPFKAGNNVAINELDHINELARNMIDTAWEFLNYRNPLLHQIGHPERTFEEIIRMADQAIHAYKKFEAANTSFFEAAKPYKFSEVELAYFYPLSQVYLLSQVYPLS